MPKLCVCFGKPCCLVCGEQLDPMGSTLGEAACSIFSSKEIPVAPSQFCLCSPTNHCCVFRTNERQRMDCAKHPGAAGASLGGEDLAGLF